MAWEPFTTAPRPAKGAGEDVLFRYIGAEWKGHRHYVAYWAPNHRTGGAWVTSDGNFLHKMLPEGAVVEWMAIPKG